MTNYGPIPGASQPKEPMRLIDAAPILKNIELYIIMLHGKADELGKSAYAIQCTKDIVKLRDFAKWLKAIPTIDLESLRPAAHWIKEDSFYKLSTVWRCSACKGKFVLHGGTPENENYQYCPACGARMVSADD